MAEHNNLSGTQLHEDKRIKQPVRAASTANVNIASPGTTLDAVTLASGDRLLLKNQSTASQNGIYVWTGSATALTRATDADAAVDFVYGFLTYVREGTANGSTYWTFNQSAAITLETTAITFGSFGAGSGTVTSVALSVPAEFSVSGSPVTSSGTLAITKANENANTVFAGPTTGVAAAPTFRTVVPGDLPVMGASGVGHAAGAVPDPGASAGATKFLREDASWQVPAGSGGGGGTTGGGGSGALVPIQVIGPLTATQATMPFSGIPQTGYRNLRVVVVARSTLAANNANLGVQFNGDTGSNYSYEALADASGGLNRLSSAADVLAYLGFVPGSTASASATGTLDIKIPLYTATTFQKAFHAQGSFEQLTTAGNQYNQDGGGFWRSTAAITSLTLLLSGGSFDVGSYACLYGEMDTAGPLLTPASNLLYDSGPLTAAQPVLDVGTLTQAYKDLRIEFNGRSTTAAVSTRLRMQVNGDTGANYIWTFTLVANGAVGTGSQSATDTALTIGDVSAGTAPAGAATNALILIPDYTNTTYRKTMTSFGTDYTSDSLGNMAAVAIAGIWKNTSAITTLKFTLTAGNFDVGSTLRVYGEPVSAGGTAYGTGTRLRIASNQAVSNGANFLPAWDTEDSDADNQHYTSAAALTGTVSKTNGSATLTGSSTAFTTELSVGQVISVPGTATEQRVVIAIASATSLTVNTAFTATASGQTASRVNTAVVFRQPGTYAVTVGAYMAAVASSGIMTVQVMLNGTTIIGEDARQGVNASNGYSLAIQRTFQQWDYIEVRVIQTSGGSVNLLADERTHFEVLARPTVIVAIPYVNIQDQKSSGTAGGTFTTGADQTRTLNTIQSDDAGIASLSSNQITLPAGKYRCLIHCPAFRTNSNQAWLYDTTGAATLIRGSVVQSDSAGSTSSTSVIAGRFRLTVASVLEVRHRSQSTGTTNGFGLAGSFGTEVYTVAEFWKEG